MPASPQPAKPVARRMERFTATPKEVSRATKKALPFAERAVLTLLFDEARGEDHVAIAEDAIAGTLGIGLRTVKRLLDSLDALGYIDRRHRGAGKKTVYVLAFNAYDRVRERFRRPISGAISGTSNPPDDRLSGAKNGTSRAVEVPDSAPNGTS